EQARLIELARGGDMHAFGRLVDAHQSAVRAFLRRLCGDAADADDFAQEAFARTWEVLDRYDGASSLRTFICGVAFQYWRRARRSAMRRQTREIAYADLADTASEPAARAVQRLALR